MCEWDLTEDKARVSKNIWVRTYLLPVTPRLVLPSSAKFCQVLPSSAKFCQVLPSFAKFCRVLPSSAKFYQVLASSVKLCQVLPSSNECACPPISLCFTLFAWVLQLKISITCASFKLLRDAMSIEKFLFFKLLSPATATRFYCFFARVNTTLNVSCCPFRQIHRYG